jgi:putative hemolysin
MEALVGEMADGEAEYDPPVVRREDGSFLIDASIELEEMSDCIGVPLAFPKERKGYYSLGGLVMGQLGHVPAAGESFLFMGLRFEVVDMDGYRIDKVLVRVGTEAAGR